MLHAVLILVVLLVAAPLVAFIPLAALAAVLVTVAWNMIERPAIAHMLRHARARRLVLATTLVVTLLHDSDVGHHRGHRAGAGPAARGRRSRSGLEPGSQSQHEAVSAAATSAARRNEPVRPMARSYSMPQ